MVRNYERKVGSRAYRNYSDEDLTNAIKRCRNGENVKQVGETYGIPYVTLYRKLKGLHPNRPGGQTAMSLAEEQAIAVLQLPPIGDLPCCPMI